MAASPQTPKVPFNRVAMDIEDDQPVVMSGRACQSNRPSTSGYRMVFGMAAVTAALLGAAVLVKQRRAPAPETVDRAEHTIQAVAKAFQQCGGADFQGPTCCKKGCACVIKTEYYSMCTTPSKTGECDIESAQGEPRLAKIRAGMAKSKIEKAAAIEAEKKKKVGPAEKELKLAEAPLAMLREKGSKARKENLDAQAALKHAEKAAKEAAEIADSWAKQYKWVKKDLDHFLQSEELNKQGGCAAINGQCGGQIAASKACCVIGCVCHWKNQYYGQCRAPKGSVNCDEGGWRAEEAEVKENATRLHNLATTTGEKKATTAKALSEAKERASTARAAAIKAGTKRAVGERHARLHKAHLRTVQRAYEKAKRGTAHARHNVKYAAAMVGVWKKVAEGDSCSDLTAEDAAAMSGGSSSKDDDDLALGDDDDLGLGDDDDDDDLGIDLDSSGDDEDDLDLGDDDDDDGDDDDDDDDGDAVVEKPEKEEFEDGADTEEIAL